jgi:hypothetical protein
LTTREGGGGHWYCPRVRQSAWEGELLRSGYDRARAQRGGAAVERRNGLPEPGDTFEGATFYGRNGLPTSGPGRSWPRPGTREKVPHGFITKRSEPEWEASFTSLLARGSRYPDSERGLPIDHWSNESTSGQIDPFGRLCSRLTPLHPFVRVPHDQSGARRRRAATGTCSPPAPTPKIDHWSNGLAGGQTDRLFSVSHDDSDAPMLLLIRTDSDV